jgi:predicted transcriptional regulator
MPTAKSEAHKLIDLLPDDASFEDIQYQLYVRQKIERGLADVRDGRVIDHDEVQRRVASWRDESSGPK